MVSLLAQTISSTEYEGLVFPASEVRTTWGHDSVRHTRYRSPGAEIETTGRKPREIKLTIPLVEGMNGPWGVNLFTRTYEALVAKFQEVPRGQLSHPTLGPIVAHVDQVDEVFTPDMVNGVVLEVSFTEHLGNGEVIVDESNVPAVQVTARAQRVDAALTGVPAARRPATPLATTMETQMTAAESATSVGETLAAIQAMRDAVDTVLSLPDIAGAAFNELRLAGELLRNAINAYERRVLNFARPRVYVVSATMSLVRIARLVYGDTRRTDLLRDANRIEDELAVPAGTLLTIPTPPDASR